jgi:predicted RNase H-like HicB family nuclease
MDANQLRFGVAVAEYNNSMNTARYVHWQDQDMWLGYFEEFPDYLIQGETLAELESNLRDLYRDVTSGEIPGIRRVAELTVG